MTALLNVARPYLIGAALIVLAGLGVWWYGASQYGAGEAKAKADYTQAELQDFKSQTIQLSDISVRLESAAVGLRDAKPKTIERYTRVEVQSPLPVDCVIDDGRLRHITEASSAANAPRKPRAAVPAGGTGDKQ